MAKLYESTYILNTNLTDDAAKAINAKFEDLVAKNGGTVLETEVWGVRKLAYMIDKHTSGRYYSLHFTGPGAVIAKLERGYHLEDEVLRWMTLEMPANVKQSREAMKKRVADVEQRRATMAKAQAEGVTAEVKE
jgi:small subunit ribosomal protein S6